MSEEFFYPEIDERNMALIARLYETNPNYFSNRECPYSDLVKSIFKGQANFQDFDSHNASEVPSTDNLIVQINTLTKELQQYGQSINSGEGTSPSDRNTYFRLSVTLLEKLVDIKEKIARIKDYEVFVQSVLDVMDKILSPDDRQIVLNKLNSLVEPEKTSGNEKVGEDKNEKGNSSP